MIDLESGKVDLVNIWNSIGCVDAQIVSISVWKNVLLLILLIKSGENLQFSFFPDMFLNLHLFFQVWSLFSSGIFNGIWMFRFLKITSDASEKSLYKNAK